MDEDRTKRQLIDELARLRGLLAEAEEARAEAGRLGRAAENAHEYAEAIVNTVREPLLVLDAGLNVVTANRAFYQTFGVPAEEAQGQNLYDLGNRQWDIPALRKLLEEILPQNTSFDDYEVEHDFEHIGSRTMLLNARCIYREAKKTEMVLLAIEDITERRLAERALAEEKERLAVTLRSIGDGVITTDDRGCISFLNGVAEALTGWTTGEASGREISEVFDIFGEETREPAEDPVTRALREGVVVGLTNHTILRARDGIERPIADSAAPIKDNRGRVFGVVMVFRDAARERRIEDERSRLQKLESVGILAGGIAHDFNNILAAIIGNISYAKVLLEQPEKARLRLEEAERASWRARDLTQQLLTFSRGGAPVTRPAAPAPLVREAVGFALQGTAVRFVFSESCDLHVVEVDEGQMNQVFHNLVINAVQAMPGGGTVTVELDNVVLQAGHLSLLPPGAYVRISIRDGGDGISSEHIHRIFDPYFTTKKSGSGLGLAVCHSIVKSHRGAILVESELGIGSTFSVFLPATAASLPAPAAVAGDIVEGRGRILVMDDDDAIRDMLGTLLGAIGYEVTSAADGAAAIELFQAARQAGAPFDVVLLDLTVPGGLGGLETFEHLRRIDPDVKAIVSSGYSNAPVVAEYARYGFRAALSKPSDLESISRVIHAVIAGSERGDRDPTDVLI